MAFIKLLLISALISYTVASPSNDWDSLKQEVLDIVKQQGERIQRLEQQIAERKRLQAPKNPLSTGTRSTPPTSCVDLWKIGHTLPGLYPVQVDNKLQIVYCDVSDFTSNVIGNVNFKQSVHFHVKRAGEYTNNNNAVIITYGTRITPHPAMDSTTGVFTVPISGTYFFHYHSYAYTRSVAGGSTSQRTKVSLLLNGEEVTFNYADSDNPTDVTMAFTATLKLVAGDHVSTRFEYGNIRDANFGGSLMEADADFSP